MYHALDDLGRNHLKWLNLWSLAESICRQNESLEKVYYFSAFARWLPDSYARHRQYHAALKSRGVTCHMARFKDKPQNCRSCGNRWIGHEEKETDVHFALSFLEDAMDGAFDRAIIVSADSDYVPAIKKVRNRFPRKEVFIAAPPKRLGMARDLVKVGTGKMEITPGRVAKHLLPVTGVDGSGNTIFERPADYAPPV